MHLDERVRSDLAATTRFGDIRFLDSVDSTNRVLSEEAAAGGAEGIVLAADLQTRGRGRLDRTWEARPGEGLLVSVLLRPSGLPRRRWHLVTAAVALAAKDACREVAGVEPWVKWPNDLMLADGKLAGILAEVTGDAVVVGMGLNVKGGPPGAAFLEAGSAEVVDRSQLLAVWLVNLDPMLGAWDRVATRYGQECATVGSWVDVTTATVAYTSVRAEAVDEDGRLVIAADGGPVTVTAADVTHVRPAAGS